MGYWPFSLRKSKTDAVYAALVQEKRVRAEAEQQVERLTEQNKKLSEEASGLLERIRELESDAAEHAMASKAYTGHITDLQAVGIRLAQEKTRIELEAADLRGKLLDFARRESAMEALTGAHGKLFGEMGELLAFVRKCATGTGIRSDKPGGQKLIAEAKALLESYDTPNDKEVSAFTRGKIEIHLDPPDDKQVLSK